MAVAVPARCSRLLPLLLSSPRSRLFYLKKKKKQVAGAMGKAVGPSRQPRTVHALNLRAFPERRNSIKEEI